MTTRSVPLSQRELFIQKFTEVFFPMLLAALLLCFVSASVVFMQAFDNAVAQNESALKQASQSMELLFGNVDTVALTVSQDDDTLDSLEQAFSTTTLSPLANGEEVERIRQYITGTAYSVPYIFSVYVYVENDRGYFLSTDVLQNSQNMKVEQIKYYYDRGWHKSYISNKEKFEIWTESRTIQRYDFEAPKELISRYRTVYPMGMVKKGVIVENVEKTFS